MTDQAYQTYSHKMVNGGLISRYAYDRLPVGRFLNLDNLESREEGTLSSRYGLSALSTDGINNFPLPAPINTLGRMQGLLNPFNYAKADGNLYRKSTDGIGSYSASIAMMSNNRASMAPYRPNGSSNPYMFLADTQVLLKDNGGLTVITGIISIFHPGGILSTIATVTVQSTTGLVSGDTYSIVGNTAASFNNSWVITVTSPNTFQIVFGGSLTPLTGTGGTVNVFGAQNWGIAPPNQPVLIAPAAPDTVLINSLDSSLLGFASFTSANITGLATIVRIQANLANPIFNPGIQYAALASVFILGITRGGGVSTVITSANHGYGTGMRVSIANAPDATYNASSTVITVTGPTTFTYVNPGANGSTGGASLTAVPSLQVGMRILIGGLNQEYVYVTEVVFNGFVANFANTHPPGVQISDIYVNGSVAANTSATMQNAQALNLSFTNAQDQPDNNLVQLFILASNPLAIQQITILFDVGDGSFTQDYYSAAVVASPAQSVASGTIPANSAQAQAVAQRAGGVLNVSTVGGNNPSLLPTDYPLLQQLQPSTLAPAATNPWTLIGVRLADFVANGAAGGPNNGWANVVSWRIQIQTQPTLSTSVGFGDFLFVGGSDLDSYAGQAYDYRSTFYNINTGTESGPSQIMVGVTNPIFVAANAPIPLAVQRLGIQVTPTQPTDPQVTHVNIYRRGGTLTQAWYFVTQIPVGTLTFLDTIADSIIEINNPLNVDADAPVTTLLPNPLSTTLTKAGIGTQNMGPGFTVAQVPNGVTVYPGQLVTVGAPGTQEQAYVIGVGGTNVDLYLQLNHGSSVSGSVITPMTASTRPQTPMNLMAIAFDKAWLAGDPNNPHVLYYSTTFLPETFPVENSLEIGTPDAPIMALIELQGLLFVFTTKRVYEILGAGSAVPTVIPTGVKHGLAAQFAWCVAEGVIYYLSYDGVYAFRGGQSSYMTEPTEWIWTGKNLGPVPAIDLTQKVQIVMAYANHEIYVRYVDQNGVSHRLISDERYGYRWRNDDQSAGNITAMYFAEDTGGFFVGKDDGMVYQDRVNDFDSGGFVAGVQIVNPINYSLQSAQMDLSDADPVNAKRNKIFQELTLDFDSAGQSVQVYLLFNGGAGVPNGTTLAMGTFSQSGRGQIQIPINAGDGQEALNVGVLLTGAATSVVTFFAVQFRAAPQAEFRQSFDTWWLGQGADEWKLTKQIFAEYKSQNSSITVNVFTDGNMTVPAFTFVLPQTPGTHRASKKVRFPATKYRLIRFIGLPTAGAEPNQTNNFELYDDTQIETKALGSAKGYQRSKISP